MREKQCSMSSNVQTNRCDWADSRRGRRKMKRQTSTKKRTDIFMTVEFSMAQKSVVGQLSKSKSPKLASGRWGRGGKGTLSSVNFWSDARTVQTRCCKRCDRATFGSVSASTTMSARKREEELDGEEAETEADEEGKVEEEAVCRVLLQLRLRLLRGRLRGDLPRPSWSSLSPSSYSSFTSWIDSSNTSEKKTKKKKKKKKNKGEKNRKSKQQQENAKEGQYDSPIS